MSLKRPGQHVVNGVHHDVQHAKSTADIEAALKELGRQEKVVTSKLDTLVASQKDLSRQLARLDIARAQLGPQLTSVRSISNGMLSNASAIASRISGAVKRLDNEQAAVKATLQVVEQVSELKACVLGVHGAMEGTQDWELAATYLHRASKVPKDVIDGAFAEEIVPTAEVPDPPRVTLDNAAETLCALFLREFENATKEGDGTKVTRFFKLFPLIGRHQVGLDAYGRYVCGGVASRARANLSSPHQGDRGMFYALNLTKLFEHIAQIIDGHEPIVTRHYGPGMMEKVIERLQVEADLQGGIILDTWADDSQVSRKLTDVKSYAFTFLVQSFLPQQRPAVPFRPNSPAVRDGVLTKPVEDESVDMKAVDPLLNEMAMMLGRWALYTKFIAAKIGDGRQDEHASTTVPNLILHSSLHRKATDLLVEPFNAMTTFFFRRSVEKAFQLDEPPADLNLVLSKPLGSSPPFITSAVDDVMYILNQVLQRSVGTSQRVVIAGVLPSISRVLSADFYGMIQRKMRDESYPKSAVQNAVPPEHLIVSFIVLMNNLDVSTDYVRRIVNGHLTPPQDSRANDGPEPPRLADLFPFGHDGVFVETQLRNILSNFELKTSELLSEAVEVLLQRVLRPRLRPVLIETFRDVDYAPADSDADSDAEDRGGGADPDDDDGEPVSQRFDRGWNGFMQPIRRISTERNHERVQQAAASHLAKMLEKRVWAQYGRVNALGAIRMERDMTEIVNVAVRGARYALRDAFTRLLQMLLVLNMDDEEWEEQLAADKSGEAGEEEDDDAARGIDWKLDASERERTRSILKSGTA